MAGRFPVLELAQPRPGRGFFRELEGGSACASPQPRGSPHPKFLHSELPPSSHLCKNTSCTPVGAPKPPPLKPRANFHKRPTARKELPNQTTQQRSELKQRKKTTPNPERGRGLTVLCVTVSQEFGKPRAERSSLGAAPKSRCCFHPQTRLEPLNQVLTWR